MTQTADPTTAAGATEIPTFHQFIAGEWCESTSGETFESHNPADHRDVVGRFQKGTKADVAMAVSAAWAARPMWQRTPAPKRGEILYRFGQLMADNKERLARAMTREMGKVIAEARGDVQEGIDIAFLMAGEGRRMHGDTVPSELPDKWAMSIRQPIGFAGIITPWNFPMAIPCWKMMPALVTGNVVIFKPSSDTPHCATLLVELLAEAGVPPGVVNLVTGTGAEVGDAIVENPDIGVISFTGSSATGKSISVRAGHRLKRLSLELGGKNGVVVLADADLAARPRHEVDHTRREPGLGHELDQERRAVGRVARRLEDHGVAGHEGRHHLPARDRDREVPGRDDPGDPDRLADAHRPLVRQLRWHRVAEHPAALAGHQVGDVDAFLDVAAGLREDLAHLAGHRAGKALLVLGHELAEAVEDLAALWCGSRLPTRQGHLGRLDRHPDVRGRAGLESPDHLASVGGVHALEGSTGHGID
ncbi:MAG TPA: aldehyde dehydrogenase family protein, partial [Candidatus Limnocylindrales bacterium]